MPKVLIIGGGMAYASMFLSRGWEVVETFSDKPDVIQFCGGADVTPVYYNEPAHPYTGCNPRQDRDEQGIWRQAKSLDIPCLGICRGSQFLNVMNGGKLFQDVDNHAVGAGHMAVDLDTGSLYHVTSTHHQMMRPNYDKGTLLAISDGKRTTHREYVLKDGTIVSDDSDAPDVEAVFYPETSDLCFQPHPEFSDGDCRELYFIFIKRHLGLEGE